MQTSKLTIGEQEKIFNECFAELSPEAQRELSAMVEVFEQNLGRGAGIGCAMSLVLSLAQYPKINETIAEII